MSSTVCLSVCHDVAHLKSDGGQAEADPTTSAGVRAYVPAGGKGGARNRAVVGGAGRARMKAQKRAAELRQTVVWCGGHNASQTRKAQSTAQWWRSRGAPALLVAPKYRVCEGAAVRGAAPPQPALGGAV